jgi:hypothetical protein
MEFQPTNEAEQVMSSDSTAQIDPVCNALVAKLRTIVLSELEEKYIWMPKAGVKQIADNVASALVEGVTAQQVPFYSKPTFAAS